MDVLLNDEGGDGPVENQCAADPALFGSPTPNNSLSAFDGEDLNGTWLLQYTDAAGGDIGTLNEWCLIPELAIVQTGSISGISADFGTSR
ncbi:MAG: proprotein convertase P-domain-containing protein [Chloroflexi bacterium]|nr:proprotein convertase P-domain-containing protein [Chloroflexota bacterium]